MGNEKYIIGPFEKGVIYECSWFDNRMNGCTGRFKAVMRKGKFMLKELDNSRVHDPSEFYYIERSDDQYPHGRTPFVQIAD